MLSLIIRLAPEALAAEGPQAEPQPADLEAAAPASELLSAAAVLLSGDGPAQQRLDAAAILASSGDPAALELLAAATDARSPQIQIAALRALVSAGGPEATRLVIGALRSPAYVDEVRAQAAQALGELGRPEAGAALWEAASDRAFPDAVRDAALSALEAHYPDVLAARGPPTAPASVIGVIAGAAGNGLTGGLMLSAVGTWGQNDTAQVIGAVGGGLIGAGTGSLYGITRATTTGQGLAYASGAGWGLSTSLLATRALLGSDTAVYYSSEHPEKAQDQYDDRAAAIRLVGALGGAAGGYLWMRSSPEPQDVLEVDAIGYLGAALGRSAATIGVGRVRGCVFIGNDTYDCLPLDWTTHVRGAGGLGGEAVGLAAGLALSRGWDPDPPQLAVGLAAGGEALWVATWLPTALGTSEPEGAGAFGFHAGLAGGLAVAHLVEPTLTQAGMAGWGALVGNAIGGGVPMLLDAPDDVLAAVMLPVGALGLAGGALGAGWVDPKPGDLAMLGVAVPLAVAEASAVGAISDDQEWTSNGQTAGLILTASGGAAAGLTVLAGRVDPQVDDMLFLGSSAVWGLWYGALTPVALGTEFDRTRRILAATLTGDAFLALGGLALPESTLGLEPRRTVVAQLSGLTGATLGALGASLIDGDSQGVARGALIGSVVGLGAGAAFSATRPALALDLGLPRPHIDLPGRWSAFAAPALMEDGAMGLAASLSATGW